MSIQLGGTSKQYLGCKIVKLEKSVTLMEKVRKGGRAFIFLYNIILLSLPNVCYALLSY